VHLTGLKVLNRLGLYRAAMSRGAVVSHVCGETQSGSKVMGPRYEDYSSGNHGLGIQRGAVFDLLRAADELKGSMLRTLSGQRKTPFSTTGVGFRGSAVTSHRLVPMLFRIVSTRTCYRDRIFRNELAAPFQATISLSIKQCDIQSQWRRPT